MIKISQIGLMLIMIYLFCSCNMSDSAEKIFGDYVYVTESSQDHFIIGGRNDIPPDVLAYEFDMHFLIAKQKPDIDVLIIKKANELFNTYEKGQPHQNESLYLKFKQYGAKDNRHENFKIAKLIAKEILVKEDPMYKKYIENPYLYWILYRSTDDLQGPLTKEEYEAARKEMKIPDKLKLD